MYVAVSPLPLQIERVETLTEAPKLVVLDLQYQVRVRILFAFPVNDQRTPMHDQVTAESLKPTGDESGHIPLKLRQRAEVGLGDSQPTGLCKAFCIDWPDSIVAPRLRVANF